MEVTSCCEKLIAELDVWKEKADRITRELDNLPSGDKEKVLPEITDWHMFIEDLCERIDRVRRDCSEALESKDIGVLKIGSHNMWALYDSARKQPVR